MQILCSIFPFLTFFSNVFPDYFPPTVFPTFPQTFFSTFFPTFSVLDFFPHFFLHLSLDFFFSLPSRGLELVGARKNGRARRGHFLARACSLFRPLLPSACYAGYFFLYIVSDFSPSLFSQSFSRLCSRLFPDFFSTFFTADHIHQRLIHTNA